MPSANFFNSLSTDFELIANTLSEGILAAYLLGYDEASGENQKQLAAVSKKAEISATANFADGDDENQYLRFDVPPQEAIDYFKRKRIVKPDEFKKLTREAKAAAFTVGGIYKEDVLKAFQNEITSALLTGQTQKATVENFKSILDGAGHKELGDFHLETVARTNFQVSYGVGRRKAMEESAALLPFWQYSAVNDDRTRPKHRALDGIVFPANHEFWDTNYPPIDFNCRCSVIALLDVPAGYDRNKPNRDTTIAYDDDGLPSKAEYLTQVVDFKATKFVGVPKQNAGLQATIEAAATETRGKRRSGGDIPEISERQRKQMIREWQEQLDDLKKLDSSVGGSQIPSNIIEDARRMRGIKSKIEVMRVYKPDGKLLDAFSGTVDEIEIPEDALPKINGSIEMHWHPPEGKRFFESFSFDDIEQATLDNAYQTLVVTENYLYSMRAPKGWSLSLIEKIYKTFVRYNANFEEELLPLLNSGAIDYDELQDVARHLVWTKLAKKLRLEYKRIDL